MLLIVLRVLQGLGAGAEQAGATTLMAEYAPVRRRGYFASLPFVGLMLGTILASGAFFLLGALDPKLVHDWLWRVPFLVSIVLIIVAVIIRGRLEESPAFVKLEKQQLARNPVREVVTSSWRSLARGIGLRMGENGSSSAYQVLAVTYITQVAGSQSWEGPLALAIGAGLGAVVLPLAGSLSDRFGRMPVYRAGAIVQFALAIPAWMLMSTGHSWIVIPVLAIAYGIGVQIMVGAQCATLPELFGNRHRYVGVAISREFSAMIAGGLVPVIGAWLLSKFADSWWPLAIYVMVLMAITIVTTFVTPETRARDLRLYSDAIDDSAEDVSSRPLRITSRADARAVRP